MKTTLSDYYRKAIAGQKIEIFWPLYIHYKNRHGNIAHLPYICHLCGLKQSDIHHTFDCSGIAYNESIPAYYSRGKYETQRTPDYPKNEGSAAQEPKLPTSRNSQTYLF